MSSTPPLLFENATRSAASESALVTSLELPAGVFAEGDQSQKLGAVHRARPFPGMGSRM